MKHNKATVRSEFLANVHSAELRFLACSDLHRLNKTIGSIRRELTFIGQDIVRVKKYDKELIYLLDFSELYSYLWPESSPSQHKVLARYILTSSPLKFTLPPGAVRELIYHLSNKASEHKRKRDAIRALLDKPLLRAFLESYKISPADLKDSPQSLTSKVLGEILDSLRDLTDADSAVSRLVRLYDSKRLVPISTYVDPSAVYPDPTVLNEAYFQLMSDRPGRGESVNYADAHNYAFTYALNNKFYDTANYYFLLVTSSPIPTRVFESIKWREDPLFKAEPSNLIRTPLVRNPLQLLYLSHIDPRSVSALRKLEEAKADLHVLHNSWNDIALYRRYVQKKDIPGSTPVRLPKNKRYTKHVLRFGAFYHEVYRPLSEIIATDAAQEQNRRKIRRVDLSAVDGVRLIDMDDDAAPQASINYRTILSLFDRFLNITEAEVTRATKSLREFGGKTLGDLDTEGLVFKPDKLVLKTQYNKELSCIEVITHLIKPQDTDGSIYFCANKFSDYISFWWRTNTDLAEYLKACRHYMRATAQWLSKPSNKTHNTKPREYQGIYFYLDNGIKKFSFDAVEHLTNESPLNENLLNLCEPQWHVRFVRLGLDYGDLCYDFEPIDAFPQRAGIVTHINCIDALTDLIQWTHTKYAQKKVIQQSLKKIFGDQSISASLNSDK